jgi:signal transduction histidine kinase
VIGDLRRLADERAALRRVAKLVGEGASSDELFPTVVDAVAGVLDVSAVTIARFEPDDTSLIVASYNDPSFGVGSRWPHDTPSLNATISKTGRPARVDYRDLPGSVAARARGSGGRFGVGVPIVVSGRVWGMISISTPYSSEPLPPETEARLSAFIDLMASAISNALARDALRSLADEQAALRRVAVLVAQEPSHDEVIAVVTEALGRLIGADLAAMCVYPGDGTATVVAGWSVAGPILPIGTRLPLDGDSVLARISGTGATARMDDYTVVEGETARVARGLGLRSTVGAPILVEGKLWGALAAATRGVEPLPADAETRIAGFTELVATAVSNAQAREDLHRLADEQAGLRRVATLVANEASPVEVFAKVAEEAARAIGLECGLMRDEGDGTATVVAAQGSAISVVFPVGSRLPLDGEGVTAIVLREGRPHRIDDYAAASGVIAEGARAQGIASAVGCPIIVRDRVWGGLVVATSGRPCPPETERRIAQFAELVATAIANAQARAEVGRLADEQAALRRVATLVAQGVRPVEIFSAVSDEVGRLFDTELAAVLRFEHGDDAIVFVGISRRAEERIPVGTRWRLADARPSAEVHRTGRAVRMSGRYWESLDRPVAETLAGLGIRCTVASPIVVEGLLWGTVNVASEEELPADAESRLDRFGELVAIAIANAEARSELAASRRRIVAASDEARRRIERDLHDGTQQQLVSLLLEVRAAEAEIPDELADLRARLKRIATGLGSAVSELREIAHGIHPAILAYGGLGRALRALADRSAIPVELEITTDAGTSTAVEIAMYYVASEALANATKHSQASRIDVLLRQGDGTLFLEIRDDGVGGADPTGSGLVGLFDRVEALGGSIRVDSAAGEGTRIAVQLPVEPATS